MTCLTAMSTTFNVLIYPLVIKVQALGLTAGGVLSRQSGLMPEHCRVLVVNPSQGYFLVTGLGKLSLTL
jgi:hypothetical protein